MLDGNVVNLLFKKAFKNISVSYMKDDNSSMSVIHFWTTSKGNLPHLYYIFYKPEPLGT